MIDYAKLTILVGIFLAGAGFGWYFPHTALVEYKASVKATAQAQEEKVKSIREHQELVTKGIQDEYDAKLALIRQYYANGVRQPSISTVSNLSDTTKLFNATTAYNELAGNCAQTTLMLVELQKWVAEQYGIK